jgi:hypothetical protein
MPKDRKREPFARLTWNRKDPQPVVPADLGKLLNLNKPSTRVTYELEVNGQPSLEDIIETSFKGALR